MSIDPTARIHPQAVIDEGAVIGPGVRIGPFSVIGPKVKLAEGVEIKSHVVITGDTTIGNDTIIFPFSVIGEIPQDLKFHGEDTCLVIGARNRIREHVTINPGTEGGGGITSIGDDCLLMAGVHVAHDCRVGNRVILVNNVGIAGHCRIEDDVIIGGISGVHQWVRIGQGAIIGGLSKVDKDVMPFAMVNSEGGHVVGLNLVGLKRRGLERIDIAELRAAYKSLVEGEGTFQERAKRVGAESDNEYVQKIVDFITGESDRSFIVPE
ncbi:acyl-[acyl-carrier-protein]--UDP-N-acetylglucosamine O-acyltransferase [Aliiruegeria haliotis]|uniref:Acyl-[acyl-carrier-protein]--UDP-N-acetylglucosamine O-acyltransferase n=1 Tax=Aliiruegeria haliotis TaxID=1280846 RepID=A0A2T0RZN8_9RHOB|nr:acyl-ACP--UDP-N-acetylglucosamine O-acyltransferase [Aliiruegeria haliotis]PRY26651.1 acyl-[acyl-carrier-protein]--UDP-N-acetylglucosamine O-acyltransferase [Aliiruegeria haliotis]